MALILPDVNVLVYAFAVDRPEHERYAAWLNALPTPDRLALADAVLLGFIRITTDRRIFERPVSTADALAFVHALRRRPRALEVGPTESTWTRLGGLCAADRHIRGRLVPDAWLAALAISHGARLATADRGFSRFPGLDFFDPAEAGAGRGARPD